MPTYEITAPDGRKFRVTGPGTRDEALAQVQAKYQPQAQQPAPQPEQPKEPSFLERRPELNFKNIYGGFVEPAISLGSSAIATPVAGLAGIAGTLLPGKQGQGARFTEAVSDALTYQPRTEGGQYSLEGVTYPLHKLAQGADVAGQFASDVTGSPAVGAAVNVGVQSAPALLFRGARGTVRAGGVDRPVGGVQGQKAVPIPKKPGPGLGKVPEAAPSIEELGTQAKAAYKRASDAGVNIAQQSFGNLKNKIGTTLKKEGLNPTLHPDASAAFREIAKTKGQLSLDQLETLRRVAMDAEKSIKPADVRMARIIVDEIDDYVANLGRKDVTSGDPKAAAALAEARSLYSRKMKAEEINNLIERARISAPNFSASGMENALRTEFRNFAKNQRKMRRFSAEEQAAIKKVAMGGPLENTLRFIGRFAPTGPLSGAIIGAGGLAIGGPIGGALPIAALGGRYAATRMTKRNASAAEELMRRGPRKRNALAEQPELEKVK